MTGFANRMSFSSKTSRIMSSKGGLLDNVLYRIHVGAGDLGGNYEGRAPTTSTCGPNGGNNFFMEKVGL